MKKSKYELYDEIYHIKRNQIYALSSSDDPLNWRYIGFTKNSLYERYCQHIHSSNIKREDFYSHKNNWIRKLLKNKHKLIITFINNLGINNDLDGKKEDFFINLYRNLGFDLTNSRGGGKRGQLSQDSINRMKSKLKGRKLTEEQRKRMLETNTVQVNQYDTNGQFIKKWESIIEAAGHFNKDASAIYVSIKRKCRCAGFQWRYCNNEFRENEDIQCWKTSSAKLKKVNKYDLNGNYLNTYKSLREAGRKNGVSSANIHKCIINQTWTSGNFYWRYCVDDNLNNIKINIKFKNLHPVKQFDKNGNFIKKYKNIKIASQACDLPESGIIKVCDNKRKTCGDFIWQYT